jgi:hypothetical protein
MLQMRSPSTCRGHRMLSSVTAGDSFSLLSIIRPTQRSWVGRADASLLPRRLARPASRYRRDVREPLVPTLNPQKRTFLGDACRSISKAPGHFLDGVAFGPDQSEPTPGMSPTAQFVFGRLICPPREAPTRHHDLVRRPFRYPCRNDGQT